jgi:hypothetical protein
MSPTVAPTGWLGRSETGDPEGVTGGKITPLTGVNGF